MSLRNLLLAIAGIFLFARSAMAADLCDIYQEYCPGYVETMLSGETYPSFADTFNVNPASIPTTLTPLGVEAIASTKGSHSGSTVNFTLIKGNKGFGFGAANNTDNTFYSYNLVQALQSTRFKTTIQNTLASEGVTSSINLGMAFQLLKGKMFNFISIPTFGANIRYNRLTQNWDPQVGASLNASFFNFGASYRKSQSGRQIPAMSTLNLTAGAKLGVLFVEYTMFYLKSSDPTLGGLPLYKRPTQIFTTSLSLARVHLAAAFRKAYNADTEPEHLFLWAAQVELLKKLSLSYQHNYLPGANSLSVQWLF